MTDVRHQAALVIGGCAALVLAATLAGVSAQQPSAAPTAPQGRGRGAPPCGGNSPTHTPCPNDVTAMMAALPATAPVKPSKPRKILALGKTGVGGFVHSSIPLASATVDALGAKTQAWATTISYDAADINTENLKQYDAIFLSSTTGCFLDEPGDKAVTDARRAALLAFVRGGKGLAGIHAASDSYHGTCPNDPPAAGAPATASGADPQLQGAWPEFNRIIGGFFKWHWNDPQLITVKIDDPKSPLTRMFGGQSFEIRDETYTLAQDSFSRNNVHVLTSIDYDKMSAEDKAKEPAASARKDGDYALSYIRGEGQGRIFYEAHGHSERIYKNTPMLEHLLAGIQYALGDLKADDAPSGYKK